MTPARRSWSPISPATARLGRVAAASDLGHGRLRRHPRGRGYVPTLLVDGDEERHGGLGLYGELLERASKGLDLDLAAHVVAEEDHVTDVPLANHLLEVVVRLRAAHADDEHLAHHLPQAHPSQRSPLHAPRLPAGGGRTRPDAPPKGPPPKFRRTPPGPRAAPLAVPPAGPPRAGSPARRTPPLPLSLPASGSPSYHGAARLPLRAGAVSGMLVPA